MPLQNLLSFSDSEKTHISHLVVIGVEQPPTSITAQTFCGTENCKYFHLGSGITEK